MLDKIISGGQTGADIAGLQAAKKLGLSTGGTMPKGFRTEEGNKPNYKQLYNVVENEYFSYVYRTEENVLNSDGTLIFGTVNSAGTKLTVRLCNVHNKPFYIVTYPEKSLHKLNVYDWVEHSKIKTLNIAGNRENSNPGINLFTFNFLINEFN